MGPTLGQRCSPTSVDQLGLLNERKHARVSNNPESSPATDSPCHVYTVHNQALDAATSIA